ncbi:MAG: FAD-dependent oxidoreductase [Burkholderiaceae bacterium]
MRRRAWLGAAASLALAGCTRGREPAVAVRWVGASHERGHRLRDGVAAIDARDATPRQAGVLVIGAGIAGLAAARALARRGIDDVHLLDLEDAPGGNSRGHAIGAQACPLGAHYLPVPGPHAIEVTEWLHEIGLLRHELGRTVPDERHLCHSPQERLFIDGAWHDGLLPPAEPGSATMQQYQRFETALEQVQREVAFALPTHRAAWTPAHQQLDATTFAAWLDRQGLHDPRLRWYLDYACRDDYGAGLDTVSAWAGLHYFASRHGFHAPGNEGGERDAVFTWPEGNAWLVARLAAPFVQGRAHTARTVQRVEVQREGVEVVCIDERAQRPERWQARAVVLAVPLAVAARIVQPLPPALAAIAPLQRHAPWLVANLALDAMLLDRASGAPPSWDNVRFGAPSLGYVDAQHQSLNPSPGATVLSAYWALPVAERASLLEPDAAQAWSRRVIDDLAAMHPDLPHKVRQVDLMRHGHAMSIPVPGLRSHAALPALAALRGPLAFAHADLSGYSVFEEAFAHGTRAGATLAV